MRVILRRRPRRRLAVTGDLYVAPAAR